MVVDTSAWKEFRVGDLFETIRNGSQVPTGSMIAMRDLQEGDMPRITVTDNNNGVIGKFETDEDNAGIYENCISVSFLGSVFYHKERVSFDMKVHCIKPLDVVLNEEIGLYLCAVIKRTLGELDYTKQISSSMLPDLKLQLPATSDGQPDWDYMERYMREVMADCERKYQILVDIAKKKHRIDTADWGEFKVGDLFELERCKCGNVTALSDGNIPYVGATTVNNGIIKYVSDVEGNSLVSKGNCMVFICDGQGSNGYQVYMEDDFIGTTTCKIGRNSHLNRLTASFLISVLDKNRERYGYGYMEKRNTENLSKETVMLPITDRGEPDWSYMESYMRVVVDRQQNVVQNLKQIALV